MQITMQDEASRIYLAGNTFPIKAAIKSAGGHWDADRRMWWIGKSKREEITKAISQSSANPQPGQHPSEAQGDATKIIGTATYKGKTYYVMFAGPTKRGTDAMKLCFRDGSQVFWASIGPGPGDAEWKKQYREPTTVGAINRFLAGLKTPEGRAAAQDRAAHPGDRRAPEGKTCGMCGSAYCEGAWGGLCEQD